MLEQGARRPPTGRVSLGKERNSRSAAGAAGRGMSVYLEWTGALPTETVDIEIARRRNGHGVLRHPGDGAGARRRAIRSSSSSTWRADFQNHHRPGRHRPRRTASAASARARRSSAARRWSPPGTQDDRAVQELAAEALEAAPATSSSRTGRFASRAQTARIELGRARRAPADARDPRLRHARRRRRRRGRTARRSAKSRSTWRPAR